MRGGCCRTPWQRLPASNDADAFPRLGSVADAGELCGIPPTLQCIERRWLYQSQLNLWQESELETGALAMRARIADHGRKVPELLRSALA